MSGPAPSKGAAGPTKSEPGKAAPAKSAPAKSGAGAGSSTKPPPQSPSPHHAGTDQPGEPAAPAKPSAPAKPASPAAKQTTPAAPAKPAGGGAPTGESGDPASGESESAEGESAEGESAEDGGEDEGGGDAPAPQLTSKPKEFPVGKAGQELVENLVHLRALRELGVLTDKQKEDYALAESKENLTVFFKGGKQRSLIIGARVFGGGDRYVMNADTGKGYVLSNSEIMRHVDGAENSLGLKNLHRFQEEAEEPAADPHDPKAPKKRDRYPGVGEIEVETPSGKRNLVRHDQADPKSGGTKIGWADKQKPGEADMTFANFLSQVERLKPVDYDPSLDVAKLTKILTLRYRKAGGNVMGTFELYRKGAAVTPEVAPSEESKSQNQTEFYVKTELTRVPGKVSRMAAERVAEDVPQLFGAPPKEGGKGQKKPGGAPPDQAGKPATGKAPTGADNAPPGAGDKSVPDKAGAGK
jgi:hypothetical protein